MTREKFADFYEYCKLCEHEKKTESEDPCWDCLDHPVNTDSHKPVFFKEKSK